MSGDGPSIANPFVHSAAQRRERAEQLRAIAQDPAMGEWRDILLRLAASYDEMASADGKEDDPD